MMNAALCCVGFMGCHSGLASYGETRHGKAVKRSKGIKKYSGKFRSLDERWGDYYYLATTKKGRRVVLNFMDPVYFSLVSPVLACISIKDGLISWNDQFMKWSNWPCVLPRGFVGTVVDPMLNIRYKTK